MNKIFKRTMAFVLVLAMVFASLVVVSADVYSEFSDFPDGWSAEAMTAAVANGLLYGMGDGTIAPKDNLTRAQMAAIINRAFGATVQTDISSFADVSEDAWYYNDIAKAVNMGTFAGVGGGAMNPDADITRQEAFAVVARALVLTSDDRSSLSRFGDGETVASWAVSDVCALVERGYVNGYTDGLLCPEGYITREEFAQMMHNIIKTYISAPRDVSQVSVYDCVMIRTPGVTIHDVKIEGDLILGDGVGIGDVNITNVQIGGRLLCRGGEGKVTLKGTTTGEGVIVKDVNGTVNFNNYRSESVFDGVREITPATYLGTGPSEDDVIDIGPVTGNTGSGGSDPVKHNVVFYYDEGCTQEYDTVPVAHGSFIGNLPEKPSVEGRSFAGWYYKDAKGNEKEFNTSTKITGNMKVYAKWNTTLTFYKDSSLTETVGSPVIFPYGKSFKEAGLTLPQKPDNDSGEEFAGWYYIDENGQEKEFTEDTTVTKSINIYAKWGMLVTFFDHYDVTEKYVGQIGNPVSVAKGHKLDKSKFPWDANDDKDDTRQFVGWFYLDGEGNELEFTETTPVNTSLKVYGKWMVVVSFWDGFFNKEEADDDLKDSFDEGECVLNYGATVPKTNIPEDASDYGHVKNSSVHSVYTTEEKHTIFTEWWYLNDAGEWLVFDETIKITKNTDVYRMFKNISFDLDGNIIEKLESKTGEEASISIKYSSDTRLNDSVKDMVYFLRDRVDLALTETDAYNEFLEKLSSTKYQIIDSDGNILNQSLPVKIIEIIEAEEIEGEIKNYITTVVAHGGEELRVLLLFVDITELVKQYAPGSANVSVEDAISIISNMTEAERIDFVNKFETTLRSLSSYQQFINSFKNRSDTYVVNSDNISFVMGVATAVKNYTYDSLRDRIRAQFGQMIDFFGEDAIRKYFNNATDEYYNGIIDIRDQIEADKLAGIDKNYEYSTSLTFRTNLMGDVIVPKYDAIMNRVIAKLDAAGRPGYDNNIYLKALVEMNLIDELFDKIPGGANKTLSGYKLKDDPIAYYDFVYTLLVLADDAALFYDYVSYDQVVTRITPHAVKLANKSLEILRAFDADGSLPGNIDDKISSIEQFKGIYESVEGIINSVVDLIIGSDIDKEYEDGTFKNDVVSAATGFINAFWNELNEYNKSGELPEKLKPILEKSESLKKIFEENKDDIDALVEKLAKLKMNHIYTEEEVAEYEKYVQHLYEMFVGTAEPTFSIDTVYEIAEFFADDLMAELEFKPESIEGYVYIDAYRCGIKGIICSVIRYFA